MKNLTFLFALCCLAYSSKAQSPILSSFPDASATIYLDFDGHQVNGTSWNMSGPIDCGASNLSSTQRTEVFHRIAEDYRPFNINITTDSTKYWNAPANKRMRIIFTVTSDWYGSAGGVAYVNSFTWGDNTPAFVFTALLNYNAKNIAEAGAHEIGHTLGLRHQSSYNESCVKTSEYHAGAGSGEIGWAPIMGVGYYRNFTLWNNGANPYGCTSYQDDLGIITSNSNGFGYRPDDFSGNASGGATTVSFTNNQFSMNGVIEKITDQDAFKFIVPTFGTFHLEAIPHSISSGNIGSNLDVQVELYSSGNNLLGTYNPGNTLSSTIDTVLEAGTYFIKVMGKGNMYAPEYASLGSYNLEAAFIPGGALPVHKLELKGSREGNRHAFSWVIDADETVVSQVLEVSSDGRRYQMAGIPAADIRSFNTLPAKEGMLQYRLKVSFDNGQHYYSNIVTLSNQSGSRPGLVSNMVQHSATVKSPVKAAYTISDYNGRMIVKGVLATGMNQINTSGLVNGMYIIRYEHEQELYTEKFMKQ
jgi:hypothetical protein